MISISQAQAYCREDISLIKNYAEAVADTTQEWICHHINGEPFTGFSRKDLEKMNMIYQRPASELMFVTRDMHRKIHGDSEQTKKKISKSLIGNKRSVGYQHTDEAKQKISKASKLNNLGNTHVRGKHWFSNGLINIMATECPEGFVKGRVTYVNTKQS